jgi:hypothetical protein
LVATGRNAEEIDNRNLVLACLKQPLVVSGTGISTHKSVVDRFIPLENLPMHLTLVIVPNFATRLREHCFDRQQKAHLLWLEDAALGIDERNALALENKAGLEVNSR